MPKAKKKASKKKKVGRPEIPVDAAFIKKVEGLAFLLLSKKVIARCLGMGLSTLMEKQAQYPELMEALKRGEARGLAELASDLRNHQKQNPGAAMFKAKVHLEWRESKPENKRTKDEIRKDKLLIEKLEAEIEILKRGTTSDGIEIIIE